MSNKGNLILGLILLASGILFGYNFCSWIHKPTPSDPVVVADTIIVKDTITIIEPKEIIREVIKDHYEYIPITDTLTINDTVYVQVQRERVVYQDSLYRAVISGIHPSLDSISVYPQTTIITLTDKSKPKHWHLGVSAGVGFTGKGISPYLGAGITYSFKSW